MFWSFRSIDGRGPSGTQLAMPRTTSLLVPLRLQFPSQHVDVGSDRGLDLAVRVQGLCGHRSSASMSAQPTSSWPVSAGSWE